MTIGQPSDAPRFCADPEVCVVGAGPQALAVVAHLVTARPGLRERIAVVDPSGAWLTTWRSQFERLQIDVLRSPSVHHPGVDPGALPQFIADQRLPRSNLPYDPPLTDVFDSFCRDTIADLGLGALPLAASVLSLDVEADGRTRVTTDAGELSCRHVIWTGNTSTPIVPAAFTEVGDTSPQVDLASSVDLRIVDRLDGTHVVIVGGGLTAGHLAMGARCRGATVTLVTRRPIVQRDFDVEPGWLGPRNLDDFWAMSCPERRLDTARTARGGGSMPRWMLRRLRAEVEDGGLDLVVGEVTRATVRRSGLRNDVVVDVDGRRIIADLAWLATGTRADVRADAALGRLVDEHVDGVPVVDSNLRVRGTDLFVAGRLATIALGPAAGNLWGARMAARRICRAITGIDLDRDAVSTIHPPHPGAGSTGGAA